MGSWSACVIGGDTPLDFIGNFSDILNKSNKKPKTNVYEHYGYMFSKETVEDKIKEIIENIKKGDKLYHHIGYQVLGYIILRTGAKITKELQKKIITAARMG